MAIVTRNNLAPSLIPHRKYDRAQVIIVAGKRGQGKTFALREYINTREPRVLCLDPFNDFKGLKLEGREAVFALADMARFPLSCRRRIRPPIGDDSRDFAEGFFSDCIDGEFPLRNCLLVLDEMTLWSTLRANKALETLVLQGRRLGLRLAIGCQRLSLIPGVLLSETTEMLLFRMTRPRDLDVVGEWAGADIQQTVPKLTTGRCVLVEL